MRMDRDGAGLARPHNVDGVVNGYGQKTLVKWNKRVRELSRRFYWGVAIKHFANEGGRCASVTRGQSKG